MQHLSYILNLSNSFNANNYLYYFLPGIASGKILLFDKLTKAPIPSNERLQEVEIHERIKELKNHWDLYRLNPAHSYDQLKINIILDFKPWYFTGLKDLSVLTFGKLKYLKQEFEQYFDSYDLSKIVFQYFVIKNKADEIEELAHFLDEKEGINDQIGIVDFGVVNRNLIAWPQWKDLEEIINQVPEDLQELAHSALSEKGQQFLEEWILGIEDCLIHGFNLKKDEQASLGVFFDELIMDFKDEVLTLCKKTEDLFNNDKKKEIVIRLLKRLSSNFYLRKNTDLLFRFTIDTQTNAFRIHDYESLTAILVESIDFFGQDKPHKFLQCGSEKQTITVDSVTFDQDAAKVLFGSYENYSAQSDDKDDSLNSEKFRVKEYKFNAQIDPQQFFQLDKDLETQFLTVNNIKHRILPFFSKNKIAEFKKELEANTIQPLEDQIKATTFRTSQMYSLDGEFGLSQSFIEMNYREIEVALEKLKNEEKESNLVNTQNTINYEIAKSRYQAGIHQFRKDFIDSMYLLPIAKDTHMFFILSTFMVLIFGLPLFTFKEWFASGIFTLGFLALLSIVALVVWFIYKSEISSKYEKVYLENIGLHSRFKEYVNALSELTTNVRKSTLRRKNIQELEQAKKTIEDRARKSNLYRKFYNELNMQLKGNGHQFDSIPLQGEPDFDLPPYKDIRSSKSKKHTPLEIESGTAKDVYKDVEAQLGVIKLIKTK